MKILDLGCGKRKIKNSFGIDAVKHKCVDLVWDLNKPLPKKLYNKFDIVHHHCVLDHLGNPLMFLQECYKCLKKNGKLIFVVDNADYWRYHFDLGNYHATTWEQEAPNNPELHHKMMFQMKHLIKILKIIGFKIIKSEYIRDYKKLKRGHIDYLMPKKFGFNFIRIKAIK